MKAVKEIIVSYLAIYGFVLIAPFFLVLVSVPALVVGALLDKVGVSDGTSMIGSFLAVFISIYVFSQIYSAVRFRKMERDTQRQDKN